jgi:hypothetical protein
VASYEAPFGGRTSLPVSGSAGLSVDAMEAGEGIHDVGQWQKCWFSYGSTRKWLSSMCVFIYMMFGAHWIIWSFLHAN